MRIDILTIFPELFAGFVTSSLIGKAQQKQLLQINLHDIRDFAAPPHFSVDDVPYGGGAGMVMKPEPLVQAIETVKSERTPRVILLSASGCRFTQKKAAELSTQPELLLICGRYEGVDQRVIDLVVDEELSIGDFVLMGGEVAAMALIEATARLIPEVVGNQESLTHESFCLRDNDNSALLEAPHYTRPPEFRGLPVPDVLLSGNHKKIEEWRREQSLAITRTRRPDLLQRLTDEEE